MKKPAYRAAVFGSQAVGVIGYGERIVMVHGPTTIEACGLYIHVDDIGLYLNEVGEALGHIEGTAVKTTDAERLGIP